MKVKVFYLFPGYKWLMASADTAIESKKIPGSIWKKEIQINCNKVVAKIILFAPSIILGVASLPVALIYDFHLFFSQRRSLKVIGSVLIAGGITYSSICLWDHTLFIPNFRVSSIRQLLNRIKNVFQ